MSDTPTKTESDAPSKTIKPRKLLRVCGFGLTGLLAVLVAGLGLAYYIMVDRQVAAPDWVRDKIEERIAETVPGLDIQFGRMSLLLQRSGLTRVILWDVDIRNERRERVAHLSDIEAGFAPVSLMKGQLQLHELQVSGAFVTLQRDEQGRMRLALGDAFAGNMGTPDLPGIIAAVDLAMQDPRLADLKAFEADALTIRYEDLRARRGWTADGGRLSLERRDNRLLLSGDVALLGGGDGVATLDVNASSEIGKTEVDLSMALEGLRSGDIASQSPALVWLADLNAPISGRMETGLAADGTLDHLQAALQIGAGVLQPNKETRALRFDEARTSFSYDPGQGLLSFDEIHVASPLGTITSSGRAQLEGMEQGWPRALTGQVQISDLTLADGTLFERDLWMSGAGSEFRLELEPFKLSVPRLQIYDPDYPITANSVLLAQEDGWNFSLDATVVDTTIKQVLSFWPRDFQSKPRRWVADNVLEGQLSNGVFALRAVPGEKPKTYLDFEFDQGKVRYAPGVPMVQDGKGRLTIHQRRLGLALHSGVVRPGGGGEIALRDSQVIIPDLRAQPAVLELRLKAQSPLKTALGYLDNDTWKILRKIGRKPDLATGQAQISGRITTKLIKKPKLSDFTFDLEGRLRDVRSQTLVTRRTLTGRDLAFRMNSKRIEISGTAELDGVSATGAWVQPLQGGDGRVSAKAEISPKALKTFGVTLPRGMVTGLGQGQLDLALRKANDPGFTLTSNLGGVGLSTPQLGWRLTKSGKGKFSVSGSLGKVAKIDKLSLDAAGLRASGSLKLTRAGTFQALLLDRFRVGTWLDVKGELRGRGTQMPEIIVSSGRVDMRRSTFSTSGGSGGAGSATPITLALNELRITDTIFLSNFRGNFQAGSALKGAFQGLVGGKSNAAVQGQAIPQSGGTAFRIKARDAGDILKAANLFKTLDDGVFQLDLAPVAGREGTYNGKLQINNTRLRNASAMAELLDAISIVGLIDQANGDGIYFTNVDAWFRLSPRRVVVTESRATGPSMGVTLNGIVDLVSGQMDMQGVLSPVFFLNGIGQLVSRPGEGLIGFNFEFKGTMDAPRVSVNPLSALTPGLFRDIFRRPPPKVSQ